MTYVPAESDVNMKFSGLRAGLSNSASSSPSGPIVTTTSTVS
jgi:hypothetical protein